MTADDFPDVGVIRRRLRQFETRFARSFVDLFTQLPVSVQSSTLSVAIRPDHANQQVSLWQYLGGSASGVDVPLDINATTTDNDGSRREFLLTIPEAIFPGVQHVRRDGRAADETTVATVVRDIVTYLAVDAGAEVARIFEYQIALVSDGLAIDLLAAHAAQCVLHHLRRDRRHLDRNSIVAGVVRGGNPRGSDRGSVDCSPPKAIVVADVIPKISIIIGERELKWQLVDIFKRPALRKEMFLFSSDVETGPSTGDDDVEFGGAFSAAVGGEEDRPPWRFYTSAWREPMLYGYRGLILEWDFATGAYRLNGEDEASFPDEADWRPDDFHRAYCPYRRLVGAAVMREYRRRLTETGDGGRGVVLPPAVGRAKTAVETGGKKQQLSFADFVRRLQGEAYSKDVIEPVYRPFGDGDQVPASNGGGVGRQQAYVADGPLQGADDDENNFSIDETVVMRRSCDRSHEVRHQLHDDNDGEERAGQISSLISSSFVSSPSNKEVIIVQTLTASSSAGVQQATTQHPLRDSASDTMTTTMTTTRQLPVDCHDDETEFPVDENVIVDAVVHHCEAVHHPLAERITSDDVGVPELTSRETEVSHNQITAAERESESLARLGSVIDDVASDNQTEDELFEAAPSEAHEERRTNAVEPEIFSNGCGDSIPTKPCLDDSLADTHSSCHAFVDAVDPSASSECMTVTSSDRRCVKQIVTMAHSVTRQRRPIDSPPLAPDGARDFPDKGNASLGDEELLGGGVVGCDGGAESARMMLEVTRKTITSDV